MEDLTNWMNVNQGMSAWIQAIGSLIALGIAIWIPARQNERERNKAAKAEVEKSYMQVNFIWSSVGMLIDEVESLMTNIEQEPYTISKANADQRKGFESILLALDAFPIHELGTAPMVILALDMRKDCHKIADYLLKALATAEAEQIKGIEVDLRFIEIQLKKLKEKHATWSKRNGHLFNLVNGIKKPSS